MTCSTQKCWKELEAYCQQCKLVLCHSCSQGSCRVSETMVHVSIPMKTLLVQREGRLEEWQANQLKCKNVTEQIGCIREEMTNACNEIAGESNMGDERFLFLVIYISDRRGELEQLLSTREKLESYFKKTVVECQSDKVESLIKLLKIDEDLTLDEENITGVILTECEVLSETKCLMVKQMPNGQIIAGRNQGFALYDIDGTLMDSFPDENECVTGAAFYGLLMYFTVITEHHDETNEQETLYSYEVRVFERNKPADMLKSWQVKSGCKEIDVPHISICHGDVYVCVGSSIYVYDMTGIPKFAKLNYFTELCGLCTGPNNSIVITDRLKDEMQMLSYTQNSEKIIWVSREIEEPMSVCSQNEQLWVFSHATKFIYLVDVYTGDVIAELRHPKLTELEVILDMSISADNKFLLCAALRQGFLRFSISNTAL